MPVGPRLTSPRLPRPIGASDVPGPGRPGMAPAPPSRPGRRSLPRLRARGRPPPRLSEQPPRASFALHEGQGARGRDVFSSSQAPRRVVRQHALAPAPEAPPRARLGLRPRRARSATSKHSLAPVQHCPTVCVWADGGVRYCVGGRLALKPSRSLANAAGPQRKRRSNAVPHARYL
jgi:hypothetical protein